jgi:hypothetical protein
MQNKRLTHNRYIVFQQETSAQLGATTLDGDILHYILGLTTTLYKIKQIYTTKKYRQQYIDEVGQFYWYLAGLSYKLAIIFNPFVPSPSTHARPFYDWARIEDRVLTIADHYKKYIAEKVEFPSGVVEILIYEILEYLVNILFSLQLDVEQCLQANVDKLESCRDTAITAVVEKELKEIKKVITRYKKRGRPTKVEKREIEILTIGESWNDNENYPFKRKRKPGVRKSKWSWKNTIKKYREQKQQRIKTRSG